jgi:hypothetical protein
MPVLSVSLKISAAVSISVLLPFDGISRWDGRCRCHLTPVSMLVLTTLFKDMTI